MKAYTDLEQSNVLSQILPLESADMHYKLCDITKVWHPYLLIGYDDLQARKELFNLKQYKPCWSLAALLNVLPNNEDISINLSKGGYRIPTIEYPNNWFVDYEDETNGLNNCATSADNPVDTCYEMILKLHELNLL